MRDKFYEDNYEQVVTDGVTLTNEWHKKLHKVYGREPSLSTAEKQKQWVIRMAAKHQNMDVELGTDSRPPTEGGRFSKHIPRARVDFASL